MTRTFLRRAVLLLVLMLLVAASLQAAESRTSTCPGQSLSSRAADLGFISQVWDLLTRIWAENGCRAEPDGRCLPEGTTAETDNGCRLDPDGRCGS